MRLARPPQQPSSSAGSMPPAVTRASGGRVAVLVAGDALSFLLFAAIGRQSHHETSGLGAIGAVALTALPFALGWFLVAPWLGVYRRSVTSSPPAMLRRTGLAWLAAWPVTLVLRWIIAGMIPPVSFAIVILLANSVLLGAWRSLCAVVVSRLPMTAPRSRRG